MTEQVEAVKPKKRVAWNKGISPKKADKIAKAKDDSGIYQLIVDRGLLGIVKKAAKAGNATVEEICSLNRTYRVQSARVLVYRAMRDNGWTCSDIGRIFGRTHGAVHYALNVREKDAKSLAAMKKA